MKNRVISALLLICAVGVIACDTPPQITEPPVVPPPPPIVPGERQFASIRLTPALETLLEGDTVRVKAVPIDTLGLELSVPYTVTYASSAPSIATVSETGLVTAITRGSADISALIVIGSTKRGTWRRAYVFSAVSPDSIVLTSGKNGWEPSQAQVAPGGSVQWRVGEAGIPVSLVYLMDERYNVVDSVDLTKGPATRRFASRGFVSYCSGSCWDPPDWGVIYVR